MGLIEQAAQRLQQLQRAGVEPAGQDQPRPSAESHPRPAAAPEPMRPARTAEEPPARAPRIDIDLRKLAAAGFITPGGSQTRVGNEFRIIKRTLLGNAAADRVPRIAHGNVIMVTSSIAGEGKTFSALNLAISITMEMDKSVLLVDADVARPAIPQLLGIPESPGLLDVVGAARRKAEDVIHPTNIPKLSVMASGKPHAQASEILSSDGMKAFVKDMASRYAERIVIFDSPPLLLTTEARVLAHHMGQIVFVVAAGSTPVAEVKRALGTIEECPLKLLLLNKASPRAQDGYGYGYGYGYGHDSGKAR